MKRNRNIIRGLENAFPLLTNMHCCDSRHRAFGPLFVHNFIRAHTVYDDPFDTEYLEDLEGRQDDDEPQVDQAEDVVCTRQLNAWCDNIATTMWEDYQAELVRRAR